jgi:hypothetical protein
MMVSGLWSSMFAFVTYIQGQLNKPVVQLAITPFSVWRFGELPEILANFSKHCRR